MRETVLDDNGIAVPLTVPRRKGEMQLAVHEVTLAGRHYIVCCNEEEASKDAEACAKLIAGLERKLAQSN